MRFSNSELKELLFHKGAYAVSEYHPAAADRVTPAPFEERLPFVENYLPFLLSRSFYRVFDKLQAMLKQQGIDEQEYRLLASLQGVESRSRQDLHYYSGLDDQGFAAELARLLALGLVEQRGAEFALSAAGEQRIAPLLSLAKVSEAEALASFNVEEALLFKRYLRKMLEEPA